MGSWRDLQFIENVRGRVSTDQFKRFEKMHHEPFFLLWTDVVGGRHRRFKVSGSTQTEYDVAIRSDGGLECSCMDARIHCRKNGCVCKHVCFMVYRVFQFNRIEFFDSHKLTCHEMARVSEFRVAEYLTRRPPPPDTIERNAHLDFRVVRRRPEPGDECPVCYDELLRAQDDDVGLLGCPTCGNGVHEVCVRRWMSSAPSKTCVYCRSDVWQKFT